jgi:hypothetical protein
LKCGSATNLADLKDHECLGQLTHFYRLYITPDEVSSYDVVFSDGEGRHFVVCEADGSLCLLSTAPMSRVLCGINLRLCRTSDGFSIRAYKTATSAPDNFFWEMLFNKMGQYLGWSFAYGSERTSLPFTASLIARSFGLFVPENFKLGKTHWKVAKESK